MIQIFDEKRALQDGFSDEIVTLAREMIGFQNELAKSVANQSEKDITQLSIAYQKYPNLTIFFTLASKQAKLDGEALLIEASTRSAPACGDWSYPVPNYSPTRYWYSSSNPAQTLLNWGFHQTASYAGGGYTRGTAYTGPYGTCSSPRFRFHGIVANSTQFNVQWGEPNPEIHSYWWPYWNWGSYVAWWHANY